MILVGAVGACRARLVPSRGECVAGGASCGRGAYPDARPLHRIGAAPEWVAQPLSNKRLKLTAPQGAGHS